MNDSDKKITRIQSENQTKILLAGLAVFSRYGYRGSTVDQIAEAAGMSKANLLYYFRRKNDIYLAVLESIIDQWLAPLSELDPDGDPAEELWAYIKSKLQSSRDNPQASRLFATEILQGAPIIKPFLETELTDLVNKKCAVLQQWINEGKLVEVAPVHLLFLIWASTQHYADFSTQIEVLTGASTDTNYQDAEQTLKTVILRGVLSSPELI